MQDSAYLVNRRHPISWNDGTRGDKRERMVFRYAILKEHSTIVLQITGVVTLSELLLGVRRMRCDPGYAGCFFGIIDLRNATTDCVRRDVEGLARFFQRGSAGEGRWAMLLHEPRLTAMSILFARAMEGRLRLIVASTWEAGCEFLNVQISPENFPPENSVRFDRGEVTDLK